MGPNLVLPRASTLAEIVRVRREVYDVMQLNANARVKTRVILGSKALVQELRDYALPWELESYGEKGLLSRKILESKI